MLVQHERDLELGVGGPAAGEDRGGNAGGRHTEDTYYGSGMEGSRRRVCRIGRGAQLSGTTIRGWKGEEYTRGIDLPSVFRWPLTARYRNVFPVPPAPCR